MRIAAAALAAFLITASVGAFAAEARTDVPWPTAGWEVSTPEAQGIASSALVDLVELGAKNDMDSLLVVRHGRIVVDAYYAPFRPGLRHLVNSVTKAVVGTLAGIAVKSGEIASVDEPVLAQIVSPDRWLLWLGILFVLSVYYFPSGVVGRLRSLGQAAPKR